MTHAISFHAAILQIDDYNPVRMKTKKQVEHYLKKKKYRSEMDFKGISLYCKSEFGIKLHVPSNYFKEDTSLDYATFSEWLEHGFGAGDVVEWEENDEKIIGLVQDGDVKQVKICLRIIGNAPNFDPIVIDEQLIHSAGKNAAERISDVLCAAGKEFGNPFFVIADKYRPISCSLVKFHDHKTGQSGFGVVRIIKKTGEIIMYCYVVRGKEVKYNMNEYLGMFDDFTFQPFTPADYERKLLDSELAKYGKTWNHFLKRIEPLTMRVAKGERYWYITDKMQVTSDEERQTATNNKRYLAANYFKRQEDAIRILEEEMEIRRNFLAEPETK